MKAICIVLFSLVTMANVLINQETKTVKATFDSFENGTYYFTNGDEEYFEFIKIEDSVLKSFDLTDEKYQGKLFNVTYEVETKTDEFGDEYDVLNIVELELVN